MSFSFSLNTDISVGQSLKSRGCRTHWILWAKHDEILSYKNTHKIKNIYKKEVSGVDWQVSQPTVFEPGGSYPPPVPSAWSECKTGFPPECRGSQGPEGETGDRPVETRGCGVQNCGLRLRAWTHLVEWQRVVEEHISSNKSDAELKMTKHVVAAK